MLPMLNRQESRTVWLSVILQITSVQFSKNRMKGGLVGAAVPLLKTKNIFVENSENIPIWFYLAGFYYYI